MTSIQSLSAKKHDCSADSGFDKSLELSDEAIVQRNELLDIKFKNEFENKKKSNFYKEILDFRRALPVFEKKDEILDAIQNNQFVVITGDIGCGKSTQIAQYILDDAIEKEKGSSVRILCTQPRRISVISIANRVAAERLEKIGKSIGYQIRLDNRPCRSTGSILYCTTGVLLRLAKNKGGMTNYSHIILDEIHERNAMSDFTIGYMKEVISKLPHLKVILMSATINSQQLSNYYDNCPVMHISGAIHPITDFYLEDILKLTKFKTDNSKREAAVRPNEDQKYFEDVLQPALKKMSEEDSYPTNVIHELRTPNIEDLNMELLESLLEYICKFKGPGAILVFWPGYQNIITLKKKLMANRYFRSDKCWLYPLHSLMPASQQQTIFKVPPIGVRKIIISTSVAEVAITIKDVVYVIDCGRTKFTRFDFDNNIEILVPEWISSANALQRRGRAGRVEPGECYRLYTRARETTFQEYATPEIRRIVLDEVILQLKSFKLGGAAEFLRTLLDSPDNNAVEYSLELLRCHGVLDKDEKLTPLGSHLAILTMNPKIGKMIIWASIFSCLDPILSIAASLTFKEPYYCGTYNQADAHKAKIELGVGQYSDHIALTQALQGYEKCKSDKEIKIYCTSNYLCWYTLDLLYGIKNQMASYLKDMKFVKSNNPSDPDANIHSNNMALIKAIICAGLYPNLAMVNREDKKPVLETVENGIVMIHPKSININIKRLQTDYMVYSLKQKSSAIYLHYTTSVTDAAVLFAAATCSKPIGSSANTIVDKCLVSENINILGASTVQEFLKNMAKILEKLFAEPEIIQWESEDGHLLEKVIKFLTESDQVFFESPDIHMKSDRI